ncbi:conjugative transposon protein TraM [Dysgonomonas sp. Marseille-P4677]|uniref:conjugative transposon protein TraM n=1 Tax=Dysgonomonas sp. Marseille-P4677 TaxID=2364790 RepID=UPI0019114864|nr:conjugative transposon protein TraM [Dysgonomonas sp. Marseille-P4677]MBK5719564.1 conjugative transposon protein TraM [Dysgonomonas sp. Marseille-P4677]
MKKEHEKTDPAREQEQMKRKQQLKKYGFFALIGIIFLGALYLIFAPSSTDKEKDQQGKGFNTEIPDPNNSGLIGDKQKAYEQEALMLNRSNKRKSLEDFSSLVGEDKETIKENVVEITGDKTNRNGSPSENAVRNSASSYRNISNTLSSFYDEPATEVDEQSQLALEWRIQELERKLEEESVKKDAVDDQLAIMEKSYQLAAKYMPGGQGQSIPPKQTAEQEEITLEAGNTQSNASYNKGRNDKTQVSVIKQVQEQTVSSLAQKISNPEFIATFNQPRNMGFNTMDANIGVNEKNTISAVIHDDQTLISGQSVRIRLTEAMIAGTTVIPVHSLLTGTAALQGERLGISINAIELGGTIIPVEIIVCDSDGQRGIFIPNSLELEAAKEIAANMGSSVGTSFTITDNAQEQITADLTKGAIQGVSQYMQKKIRQVKVHLKGGYRVLLLPKQN